VIGQFRKANQTISLQSSSTAKSRLGSLLLLACLSLISSAFAQQAQTRIEIEQIDIDKRGALPSSIARPAGRIVVIANVLFGTEETPLVLVDQNGATKQMARLRLPLAGNQVRSSWTAGIVLDDNHSWTLQNAQTRALLCRFTAR
jgi:hypothetical protein